MKNVPSRLYKVIIYSLPTQTTTSAKRRPYQQSGARLDSPTASPVWSTPSGIQVAITQKKPALVAKTSERAGTFRPRNCYSGFPRSTACYIDKHDCIGVHLRVASRWVAVGGCPRRRSLKGLPTHIQVDLSIPPPIYRACWPCLPPKDKDSMEAYSVIHKL